MTTPPPPAADLDSVRRALDALDAAPIPTLSAFVAWTLEDIDAQDLSAAVRRVVGPGYRVRGLADAGPRGTWCAGVDAAQDHDLSESAFARIDRVCALGGALARTAPRVVESLGALGPRIADTPGAWSGSSPWRGWLASMLAIGAVDADFAVRHGVMPRTVDVDLLDARHKAKAAIAEKPDATLADFRAEVSRVRGSAGRGRTMQVVRFADFVAASRAAVGALERIAEATAPERKPENSSAAITDSHAAMLRFLSKQKTLIKVKSIGRRAFDDGCPTDEKHQGRYLRDLEKLGFAHRPKGARSGYEITDAGRRWLLTDQ